MKRLSLVVLAVLVAVATLGLTIPSHVFAQSASSTASLSGTISDSSGARVAQATVKLTCPEKGITRTFTTGAAGDFTFALLPAASYLLEVDAKGFQTTKQTGIVLQVGDAVTEDIPMKVIGNTEQVTVTEEMPLLQTEDSNVGTEITTKQVQELPLNYRNVVGLTLLNSSVNNQTQQQILTAGGTEDTADQDISFLSFGGGYFGSTAFILDGGWNVANGWGGVIYVPSVEDVQEFKVINNSFSAQYGWSTGNAVNIITKSGTNSYHGDVFDFLRNQALDANTYFNNLDKVKKSPDHREQFGGVIGGPLYIPGIYRHKDKTFFFFNYEGLRLNGAGVDHENVPTTPMESGDFSSFLGTTVVGTDALGRPIYAGAIYNPYTTRQVTATSGPNLGKTVTIRDAYAGNMIPSSGVGAIDSLAKAFASGNYWPGAVNPGGSTNFNASGAAPTTSNEYGIRIDHNFNDATRVYGRWSRKFESKTETPTFYGASDVGGPGQSNPNNRYSAALGASRIVTPTFIVSVNAEFNRWIEGNDVQGYGFKSSTLGLPGIIDTYSPQFPQVNIAGYAPLGARGGAGEDDTSNNTGTLSIDVSKIFKAHSLSFGFMDVLIQTNGGRLLPTAFNFNGNMTAGPDPTNPTGGTGNAFASFMAGAGVSGSTGFAAFPASTKYQRGLYIQDDWKVNNKLTVNLGLRYETQNPLTERHNEQAYFDYNVLNPISVEVGHPYYGAIVYNNSGNRSQYVPNWLDFAPRVGFAYSASPKLVVRGGFGIFYSTNLFGNNSNPGYSQSTGWSASLDGLTPNQSLARAFSTGVLAPTGNALQGLTNVGQAGGGIDPNRPDPETKQFMFGAQYAFNSDNLLDVSYIGNRGTKQVLGSETFGNGMNYGELSPSYLSMGSALNNMVANPFANAIKSSSCGLNNATVPAAQLLLPYPEFCGAATAQAQPVGFSNYNALQASFTHRMSHDLTFTASYTYSKFLDDVGGAGEWASTSNDFTSGGTIRNYYDLAADKSVDSTDIPQGLVMNYVYGLPVGKGKKFGSNMNAVENAVAGGWQISGLTSVKAGFPLSVANGGANPASLWGGNQHATMATGANMKSGTCGNGQAVGQGLCWFNPAAFTATPSYQFGNAPRYFSNLRAPGYVDTDLAIQKWFVVKELYRIQFRAEMFNAFNHANFTAPDIGFGDSNFGQIGNTEGARQVQLGLKIYR